jgi:hypothetical protein
MSRSHRAGLNDQNPEIHEEENQQIKISWLKEILSVVTKVRRFDFASQQPPELYCARVNFRDDPGGSSRQSLFVANAFHISRRSSSSRQNAP